VDHRRYLRPAKAAEKIDITVGTLANWRWRNDGPPFYRVGDLILYADDEIDAWIAAGRQPTEDAGESNAAAARSVQLEAGCSPARTGPAPRRNRRQPLAGAGET
jgi:hypothetical protein